MIRSNRGGSELDPGHGENAGIDRGEFVKRSVAIGVAASALGGVLSELAGAASAATGPVVKAGKASGKAPKDLVFKMQNFIDSAPYFRATEKGGRAAAKHFGIGSFENGGPQTVDTAAQVAQFNTWVAQKVDAICVAAADAAGMTPAINKAVAAGVIVVTYDADAANSNRYVFNNPADNLQVGHYLMDQMARQIGKKGKVAIVTGALTQPQQQRYVRGIKEQAAKYPGISIVAVEPTGSVQSKGVQVTQQLMTTYPDLAGVIAPDGSGFPGACQAIKGAGKSGKIAITGLSLPSLIAPFVKDGTVKGFYLWDAVALGYRAVATAFLLSQGKSLKTGMHVPISDSRSPVIKVEPSPDNPAHPQITLGPPLLLTAKNIGNYPF